MKYRLTLLSAVCAFSLFGLLACEESEEIAAISYQCGTVPEEQTTGGSKSLHCGEDDPLLPPEPTLPIESEDPEENEVCEILYAEKSVTDEKWVPDENNLDTARIQAALTKCSKEAKEALDKCNKQALDTCGQEAINACTCDREALDACKKATKRRAVKLTRGGRKGVFNAFVAAHLDIDSVTLWVDEDTTLFASRNPDLYQKTGNCGVLGVNDSGACNDFITVSGAGPGIVGKGTIDGQAGEPLVDRNYSWWQASYALREIDGSIGNPTLINLASGTTNFLLYKVTIQNSPKFHVKITSMPAKCTTCPTKEDPSEEKTRNRYGYIVWGVTLLTPSRWFNSQGLQTTPHFSRNSDGVDPGTTAEASCGVIACSTISTGDDQIAIKGGHRVSNLIIAHNHFGTGHGISIGSETYGTITRDGVTYPAVENVEVYDLTIDGDSRGVGYDATAADFNGIRIKSDTSRGGVVENITYRDICMRDMVNAILVSTAYNPLFGGSSVPQFGRLTFQNIRHVTCMGTRQAVVTLEGFDNTHRTGPVTLDNVVIDNIGPNGVYAEFADIVLGPGKVNFEPDGFKVKVTDETRGESEPKKCVFPALPAPKKPPGWLR